MSRDVRIPRPRPTTPRITLSWVTSTWKTASWVSLCWLTLTGSVAFADPPVMSPEQYLTGDAAKVAATDVQEYSRIAAGGPGYLVVWEEHRPVISGVVNAAYTALTGNQVDIYGARLDANGNMLDAGPILICQEARNQSKPQVAWNAAANAWFVVWTTERPDWYFFEDIVGVRVSAGGAVLDPTPIMLRPETNSPANNYAQYPTIASDGVNWLVVWIDILWSGQIGRPNVAGKRINASGVVLDPAPVVLYQHPDQVFGPIVPHLAWATDEYLIVWERAGIYTIHGKRIGADLHAIDTTPFTITASGFGPRVTTNGTDFLVSTRYFKVHRVTHAGVSLDPTGITLPVPQIGDYRGPDVSWNGTHYLAVNSGLLSGDATIWMTRISTAGTVVGSGTVRPTGDDQYNATVASTGGGSALVTWGERDAEFQYWEDIRGARTDGNGIGGAILDVSAGLHRQTYLRIAENGNERLMVYLSEGGGTKRIVAQRTDASGNTLDAEPTEVASIGDGSRFFPAVAWNGTQYLVVWDFGGSVYGRRLNAAGQPIDAGAVLLLTDSASGAAVGTLGANFYLAYVHTFSGDQNYLKGVRIDPATLAPIGATGFIGPGFVSSFVQVRELGGRALVVYEDQGNHDVSASTITAVFIESNGSAGAAFHVGTAFDEDMPDVAVTGDRALVTWTDRENYEPSGLVGRLLNADGSFRSSTFLICDAPNEQMFSACGWDGNQFVVAWTDYRDGIPIEQLRGNIWAAGVDAEGTVQDPGGFQVTDDVLPEDLPKVTGANGKALIAYSRMTGPAGPEVQRIGFRLLGVDPASVDETAPQGAWMVGPSPFRRELRVVYRGHAGARPSNAVIEIFGLDGRRVARSGLNVETPHFVWDGRADDGEPVSSGVYFVRVNDGPRRVFERRVIRIE